MIGYSYIHSAVDDHSRLAYSEVLPDERKDTAIAFWQRANAFFAHSRVTVERVLTDNGACYKARLFTQTLAAAGIAHKKIRPYRPQTNGKVERFNRTLLDEWPTCGPTPPTTRGQRPWPTSSTPTTPLLPHRTRRPTSDQPRQQRCESIPPGASSAPEVLPMIKTSLR